MIHPTTAHSTVTVESPLPVDPNDRCSRATCLLEEAWEALRRVDARVPAAILLVMDVEVRRRKRGHFVGLGWSFDPDRRVHEVSINPRLFSSPRELLATLLHEATHAIAHEHGIRDTHQYYHLKSFRDLSRTLGLECGFRNRRYGWTSTRLPPEADLARYATVLKQLAPLLHWQLKPIMKTFTNNPLPSSGHVVLRCGCPVPRRIFATPTEAARGGIQCHLCIRAFEDTP